MKNGMMEQKQKIKNQQQAEIRIKALAQHIHFSRIYLQLVSMAHHLASLQSNFSLKVQVNVHVFTRQKNRMKNIRTS